MAKTLLNNYKMNEAIVDDVRDSLTHILNY